MDSDVIIVGAGPAGLSLARALGEAGLAVTVTERQSEPALAEPAYDGREIALTHHSKRVMTDLGLWQRLPADRISLIRHARVLNGASPYSLHFDHREAGTETLGFMVSNHRIRKAAFDAVRDCGSVTLMADTDVTRVRTDAGRGTVTLGDGRTLSAPLVVAADSRFSATRRMMGIPADMLDFGRTCIVCRMTHERSHQDTAFECFHDARTLAVLPLTHGEVSVVITLGAEEADGVLGMPEQAFNADIGRRLKDRLGSMALVGARHAYPLVAVHASRFHARRFALVGDAAVGMHPVTAHGFNLGLRGAGTLAQGLITAHKAGHDLGAPAVLRRYTRRHRLHTLPLYHGTNAIVQLYTRTSPPARLVRAALLRLGNRIGPARRLIMSQLTETAPV